MKNCLRFSFQRRIEVCFYAVEFLFRESFQFEANPGGIYEVQLLKVQGNRFCLLRRNDGESAFIPGERREQTIEISFYLQQLSVLFHKSNFPFYFGELYFRQKV